MSSFNLYYTLAVQGVRLDARVEVLADISAVNILITAANIVDITGELLVAQQATLVLSSDTAVETIRRSQCSSLVIAGFVSKADLSLIQGALTTVVQGQ